MDSDNPDDQYDGDPTFRNDSDIDEGWVSDATGFSNAMNESSGGLFGKKASDDDASPKQKRGLRIDGGSKNSEKNDSAADKLKVAENGGLKNNFGSRGVNDAEAGNDAGWNNNVAGKALEAAAAKSVPGGQMIVNKAKKLGPFGIILVILMITIGVFSGAQSLAPFGLVANGLDQFNSLRTSMNKRSKMVLTHHWNKMAEVDVSSGKYDTQTTKGHIAGWFDKISNLFHRRINDSRNRFKSVDDESSADTVVEAAHTEGLANEVSDSEVDSGEHDVKEKSDPWEESDPKTGEKKRHDGESVHITNADASELARGTDAGVISGQLNKKIKAQVASMGMKAGIVCGVVRALSMVNMIVAGLQVANTLNYVTGFLEGIQKIQAGDGGSQLHYYMNSLSQKADTLGTDGQTPVKSDTNAFQSDAWNQFFSSGSVKVSSTDEVAKKFNQDYILSNSLSSAVGATQSAINLGNKNPLYSIIDNKLSTTISTFSNRDDYYNMCVVMDMGQSLADGLFDFATVVGAFFTGGATLAVAAFKELAKDVIYNLVVVGIVSIVSGLISAMLPYIAKLLVVDYVKNMAGEDAAYAINSGFNLYLGRQMQAGSGLPGTLPQVMAQYEATQEVIAEQAEYERQTHSPFDVTNKYTFLGSIMNSIEPIAGSLSGSPLGTISSVVGVVGDSISGILPTASAAGEADFQTSLNYDCPSLEGVKVNGQQVVADAYCNPYFVTNMDTMDEDMDSIYQKVKNDDLNNFSGENDDYGNPKINLNSSLGKWIIACSARDSKFGVADMNIAGHLSSLTDNATADAVLTTGTSVIPIAGDSIQAAQSGLELANIGWTNGKNCVDPKYQSYSRYSEDQRLLESSGAIQESAVSVALEEYYEKNPIDNSLEGQIAQYSGVTKDDVELALNVADYYVALSEYDATGRKPSAKEEKNDKYMYDSDEIVASILPDAINNKRIIYRNTRLQNVSA